MRLRSVVCAAIVLAFTFGATVSHADNVEGARAEFVKGNALYGKGDYAGAKVRFTNAALMAPSPILHYNIGLCEDRLGNVDAALENYRAYLVGVPTADNRAEVEASIARLANNQRAAAAAGVDKPPGATTSITGSSAAPDSTNVGEPGDHQASSPQVVTYDGNDPMLQRAAAIDVAQIRDNGVTGEPDPAAAQGATPAIPTDEPKEAGKPLYKSVWFWLGVGIVAIVVIDLATSDSSDSQPVRTGAAPVGGLGFRF